MAFSLLALLDDITATLDDIAAMSKIAAKKTSAILGDDLALNAEQLNGIASQRELPVIWAVAKGSLINKAILVPCALAISFIYPPLVNYLLLIGGLYLCFEGVEKVIHSFHKPHLKNKQTSNLSQLNDKSLEKKRINGAIRTDFILSAEIIVILLGSLASYSFGLRVTALILFSILLTFFVYGLVAAIVRMDDVGFYLLKKDSSFMKKLGASIIKSAPFLMKTLSVVGTVAMFFVGGGLLVHNISILHHLIELVGQQIPQQTIHWLFVTFSPAVLGGVAGLIIFILIGLLQKIRATRN